MAEELREQLFKKLKPADLFIIPDSEELIGRHGIVYRIQGVREGEFYELELNNTGRGRVQVTLFVHSPDVSYPRFLATVPLSSLADTVRVAVMDARQRGC